MMQRRGGPDARDMPCCLHHRGFACFGIIPLDGSLHLHHHLRTYKSPQHRPPALSTDTHFLIHRYQLSQRIRALWRPHSSSTDSATGFRGVSITAVTASRAQLRLLSLSERVGAQRRAVGASQHRNRQHRPSQWTGD